MSQPTILTCAVTGNLTKPSQTPALPITPEQIADSSIAAAKAGAAIVHIHVRDPQTGGQSMEIAYYREVMDRIRNSGVDVIINLTTGPGGRFVPDLDNPRIAAPETSILPPLERVEHIAQLKPEICTLDLNTMWSGTAVVINTPRNVRIMSEVIKAAGTLPEIEIFDGGDIQLAKDMLADGSLDPRAMFQLVLGVKYGAAATPETLPYLKNQLPQGHVWAAFGVGRYEYPVLAQSFIHGGHVRVGLEDNIYLEKGRLAKSNAELVERGVEIIRLLGGRIATPAEARGILGLPQK